MRERNDWFEIWFADQESILETMVRNMAADLDSGYNYFGNCISKQRDDIDRHKKAFDQQMLAFADMDDKKMNRWCYFDLRRRGVIS